MSLDILLLGKTGQIGFELQRSLAVIGRITAPDRRQCDLSRPESVRAAVRAARPDVVVNAAAWTDVDGAERDGGPAMQVNGEAPGVLAAAAAQAGALLVHYSSDYVFDGAKQDAYAEDDPVAPLNRYGQSKAAGEAAIRAAWPRHLILRAGWVFGLHGANFMKTVLELARERDMLEVVADQYGAPTGAALVADVTAHLLARYGAARDAAGAPRGFPYGTYHVSAGGVTSWYEYARRIVAMAGQAGAGLRLAPEGVRPVAAAERPQPARRPANSRLDTSRLRAVFGLALPRWECGVDQAVAVLAGRRGSATKVPRSRQT